MVLRKSLSEVPPKRRGKFRKGGRLDDDVVYSPRQLSTTRHLIPTQYPMDVLPNPGQTIRLDTGEGGRMIGWAKDDHQPVVDLGNGQYAAFTPQAWLPEVTVKGKRHLPTDDLDKLFAGMMAAPMIAYGLPAFANTALGSTLMPYIEGAGTLASGVHLASEDGVRKTYNLLKDGRYWEGFGSGVGDLLDVAGLRYGFNNFGKNIYNSRIATNIRDRNKFAYDYILPFGYNNAKKRGMEYVKAILTQPSYKPNEIPKGYLAKDGYKDKHDEFRDIAFAKYLGLKEKEPLYISNGDGTYSYNLNTDFLKNTVTKVPAFDFLTGNGGHVTNDFNFLTIGRTNNGFPVKVARMYDTWDLNPFYMSPSAVTGKRRELVRHAADGLYKYLYDKGIYRNANGYKYLGGHYLNNLRYGYNPKTTWLDKKVSKLSNIEIGNILGGKPFILDHKYPIYKAPDDYGGVYYKIGLPDEIGDVTPEGEKWLKHFENIYKKNVNRLPKEHVYQLEEGVLPDWLYKYHTK